MIRRILMINFGGLGDEILFLPTLISIKKAFPDAKITLAVEPRSQSITQLTDTIDDIITVDIKSKNKYSEIFKLITKAIFGNYQMVIASGANKFMPIIELATFIPKRIGYDTGLLSRILLTNSVKLNKNQYAGDMYQDLIFPLTDIRTPLPVINIQPENKIPNSVLIHPGVSKMSINKGCIKSITSKEWAILIDKISALGKQVYLAGGPDDEECINEIIKYSTTKNFKNLYGMTKNVSDLAKLISSAEKFVCSDSAPLHIAVAMDTKTYAFFGPTDDKKLLPKSPNFIALKTNDTCPEKPCLWERRKTSCQNLDCLKYDFNKIANQICS